MIRDPGTLLRRFSLEYSFLVGLILVASGLSLAGSQGTMITGTKTAAATISRTETYTWSIQKSSTGSSAYTIATGNTQSLPFSIQATRADPSISSTSSAVSGQVCLTNTGTQPTSGLYITDQLEQFNGSSWSPIGGMIIVPVPSELNAGQYRCHSYTISGVPLDSNTSYRNHAVASIDNYSGFEGTSKSIDIFQSVSLTVNTSTIDASATLADLFTCPKGFSCSASSLPSQLSSSQTLNLNLAMTNTSACCGQVFTFTNTAQLTPSTTTTQRSSSATVGVNTGSCPKNFCYSAGSLSLGDAARFTILGLANSIVDLSSVTVNGDVAASTGGSIRVASASTVNGSLYLNTGATYTKTGVVTGSIFTNQTLTSAWTSAQSVSAAAATLTPNLTYTQWNTALNIIGNGSTTVIRVGSIKIGRADVVTLTGGANDLFIINVVGSFEMSANAKIVGSGVSPNQILINLIGTESVTTRNANVIEGILLGPNRSPTFDGLIKGAAIFGGSKATYEASMAINGASCGPPPTCSSVFQSSWESFWRHRFTDETTRSVSE
jgi:hypothetical protein